VTERFGDDEPRRPFGLPAGRAAQRGGSSGRHIDIAADDGPFGDGLVEGNRQRQSADNLMTGDVPEEDGVDQRVEPPPWLNDRSAKGVPGGLESGQTIPADQAGAASRMLADGPAALADGPAPPGIPVPGGASLGETPLPADGRTVPPYQRQTPPYPAQLPPQPEPTMASKVTAPFAALTRPKARKPAAPAGARKPAQWAAAAPRPAGKAAADPTRRAHLVLSRIEPWSVMKFSFMVSLVGWVVLFVAVTALYYVLSKLGVFHSLQSTITSVTSGKDSAGADANGKWFSASRILGYTMLVGAINVILITALATIGAVVYNLVTHLAGGIEVTLKETD
jgi:hypothetical protein